MASTIAPTATAETMHPELARGIKKQMTAGLLLCLNKKKKIQGPTPVLCCTRLHDKILRTCIRTFQTCTRYLTSEHVSYMF